MTGAAGAPEQAVAHHDQRLVARVADGDVDAFEHLYDRYAARAYRVARSISRDDGRAEDAVQEAFLAVWRAREAYRPELGTVAAWILTTVRHRAIDLARRNGKHASRRADSDLLPSQPASDDVAAEAMASADAPRLRALLEQIPEAQREVIVLAYYGQLSHVEIADHLDLPPGTVKGRMRLGLQKLRVDLERVTA